MSPLHLDDLPAAARARIKANQAERVEGGEVLRRRPGSVAATEPGLPVVCATCGAPADGETAQKRHQADTGHARYECVL